MMAHRDMILADPGSRVTTDAQGKTAEEVLAAHPTSDYDARVPRQRDIGPVRGAAVRRTYSGEIARDALSNCFVDSWFDDCALMSRERPPSARCAAREQTA